MYMRFIDDGTAALTNPNGEHGANVNLSLTEALVQFWRRSHVYEQRGAEVSGDSTG